VGFYPQMDPAHVSRIVQEEYARLDGPPIRDSYRCSLSEMARCAEQARGIVNHHRRCSSRADVASGKGRRCSALAAARRN
jgi:hypothetical protein